MRVAVFTDNDFDKVNGVTTALTAVLRHAPADIAPRVYTASALGLDEPDYFAAAAPGMPIPFYSEMRVYWPPVGRFLDRVRADGVQVIHLTTPGPIGVAALWVARRTGLPLVGSFHTDLEAYTTMLSGSRQLGHAMRVYMRWLYSYASRVLVPSEDTRRLLLSRGMRAERLGLWPRGVDTELFSPARRSDSLRRAWGASDDVPVLIYVGRLSLEKDVMRLPEMSAALERQGVRHRLVFAGDGPVRRQLQEACPNAVFLGSLGRDAVATAFASADVFAFPSRTDTAGNVVLEAQASGLPVVTSGDGGPKENFAPGLSGLVCPPATGAWVAALSSLLSDDVRRRDMSAAARAYALTRRWDLALAPLFDAYRDAASASHRVALGQAALVQP